MQRGGRFFASLLFTTCPCEKFFRPVGVSLALALSHPAWAQGDEAIRKLAEPCFACHGPNGNSQNPDYPVLAGQSWRYIYIELKDFKEGRRVDPVMSAMASGLSRDDMIALGNFFAAQKPLPIAFKADGAKVEAGRKISDAVLCPMCHLGGFVGQNEIPKVAGPVPAIHPEAASGLPRQASDQRRGQHDERGGNAVG